MGGWWSPALPCHTPRLGVLLLYYWSEGLQCWSVWCVHKAHEYSFLWYNLSMSWVADLASDIYERHFITLRLIDLLVYAWGLCCAAESLFCPTAGADLWTKVSHQVILSQHWQAMKSLRTKFDLKAAVLYNTEKQTAECEQLYTHICPRGWQFNDTLFKQQELTSSTLNIRAVNSRYKSSCSSSSFSSTGAVQFGKKQSNCTANCKVTRAVGRGVGIQ